MGYWIHEQSRLLKSVRIIKAFYESKLQAPLELLKEAPADLTERDLAFSGAVTAYGMWGLRSAKPLSNEIRTEMLAMFESVLGGLEELETKRQHLERMQLHLERALNGTTPDNVIAIRRKPLVAHRGGATFETDRRYLLKLDCLIEGKNVEEIHKMAMELHTQGSRMAFLDYTKLEPAQRQSISQLLGMGAITLYIPNLLDVTPLEQEILRHVILQDTLQRPLLMVGTTMSYGDLRGEAKIDSELLVLLSRAYIKLTRPFSEYKEQGLIHYFLDTLSESPT